LLFLISGGCQQNKKSSLSLPYEKYKLDNGLTVILNSDKSDPIALLVILYHVGSNREVPGKTGFAHLFEHMMFQRSENVGEDQYFKYIEGAGGQLNGRTNFDQTIYFEVVPKNVTLTETRKFYHEDNFARAPQLNMVYPVPEMLTKDAYSLDVLAQLLGTGKKSPMYKVLVREKKLTSNVSVYNSSKELAGEFRIAVTANPSTSLNDVEQAIFESFTRFETDGFTESDLERIKAGLETNFYNQISSVMYKGFMLAYYQAMAGSPDYLMKEVDMIKSVTREDVLDVYNRYVKGKNYVQTSFVPKDRLT
jgi:predicted Zn-dependent peptidase